MERLFQCLGQCSRCLHHGNTGHYNGIHRSSIVHHIRCRLHGQLHNDQSNDLVHSNIERTDLGPPLEGYGHGLGQRLVCAEAGRDYHEDAVYREINLQADKGCEQEKSSEREDVV